MGIITKSKIGIVTRNIMCLAIGVFPTIVIESRFPLLPLRRLLSSTLLNRYIYSQEVMEMNFTTTSRNVSVVTHAVFLVLKSLFGF